MPLVRVEVRNEYGLGPPKLYKSVDSEDPKAVLDGVAVAGLVGILRQLGDLAEFAAEVFHGLQEQVMITSSRSHKLILCLQRIEAELPPIEKAILAQRSHLHFAYTSGTNWHSHVQNSQNQFIYGDLPRFIMNSYEECREPPHLHLLDKFDVGGPGSCLKRYSDPTFFKRASSVSDEVNLQRVSKENRVCRIKKKGSEKRNGEISNGASLSRYTDSMQFGSLKTDGQNSAQRVSTFNVTFKSDLGVRSNSSESRTGSGFIECIFNPSYSMQSEVYEPKESPSAQPNMPEDDTFYSTFIEGKTGGVDDGGRYSSPQYQNCLSSSFGWDKKTEIVEPTEQQCDHDENTQVLSTNFHLDDQERVAMQQLPGRVHDGETQDIPFRIFDQDIQETGATTSKMVDLMGVQYDNTDMGTSIFGGRLHDSIESETDNYMDALNFIESESETDIDFQTKHEVENFPNLNKPVEDMIPSLGTEDAEVHPSYFEPHIAADSPSNNVILGNNSNLVSEESEPVSLSDEEISEDNKKEVSFDCYSRSLSLQMADESPKPSSSEDIDLCGTADILDSSNVESAVSNISCCGSREPNSYSPSSDVIIGHYESPKPAPEPASSSSIKFWTNGGLLGLEPLKPPDFSSMNAICQDSVASNKDEKPTLATIDKKLDEFSGSNERIIANHSKGHSCNETSNVRPGTESEGSSNAPAIQIALEDGKASSRMFDLSNRFLVSGLQRKLYITQDDKSDPSSSLNTILSEEKSGRRTVAHQNFSRGAKELFQYASPVISPPPSPPLQHMRISFQPTDSFETFKLKLKFPNENNSHEGCEDMFPSFQLVPEPAVPLHDTGSDSNDDTFSRSPYMSDDCLSRYSESNSEHWDSVDSPGSKDHDLVNSMEMRGVVYSDIGNNSECQNSLFENGLELSHSGGLPDFPMFDSLDLLLEPKTTKASPSDKLFESNSFMEPNPSPPPLPPMQWRSIKLNLSMDEEKPDDTIESINYTSEPMPSGPTISQLPKPAPLRPECNIEAPDIPRNTKTMMQNGHKEMQAANGNILDEKQDLLHQIRAKSLNLRPTVVANPTVKQGPPSNANVSAILEKANAIRQVVGSDDGEDGDSWSDT